MNDITTVVPNVLNVNSSYFVIGLIILSSKLQALHVASFFLQSPDVTGDSAKLTVSKVPNKNAKINIA